MRTKTTRTTYYNDKSKVSVNMLKLVIMGLVTVLSFGLIHHVCVNHIAMETYEIVSCIMISIVLLVSLVGLNGGVER